LAKKINNFARKGPVLSGEEPGLVFLFTAANPFLQGCHGKLLLPGSFFRKASSGSIDGQLVAAVERILPVLLIIPCGGARFNGFSPDFSGFSGNFPCYLLPGILY
jgi:hypothetical protein